jgi:pyridoxamine 5'-phosphate oxidase
MSIDRLRISYVQGTLAETDCPASPHDLFRAWFQLALDEKLREPNAMTLATADTEGVPSARIVLLKGHDEQGFRFFTNYESRKGEELAANPHAALVFFWNELERQVRIEGMIEKLSREESETYFHSRPRESQIGAWVSRQSSVVASRAELEAAEAGLQSRYPAAVPLPDFWGGFLLRPHAVEFWQGRPGRIHDRLRYRLQNKNWLLERLAP